MAIQDPFVLDMKARLEAEQQRLQDELARSRQLAADDTYQSENAGVGNHMADDASEMFEQEKNLALLKNIEDMLSKVDAALHRIEHGTYGKCENCGQEISRERLEALPWARLCLNCKSLQEKR